MTSSITVPNGASGNSPSPYPDFSSFSQNLYPRFLLGYGSDGYVNFTLALRAVPG
jgi:hypothetical protein